MKFLKDSAYEKLDDYSCCYPLFDIIFRECPDGIVYKDKNLNYISANPAFCTFFGIKNFSNIAGKKDFPFLSEKNKKMVIDINRDVAESMQSTSYVISVNIEGKEAFLNVTTTPIIIKNSFEGNVSIIKDITQEEFVKEQFVQKHCKLKSFLENIPMLIYMHDKNLNYIDGTKDSLDFVTKGYDAKRDILIDVEQTKEESRQDKTFVIENNKVLECEKNFKDVNGTPHWYKIYKVPMNDVNGDVSGVITIVNNIDLEKRLQFQKDAFVATLGHDLKNPTVAQIRSLELLLSGTFGELNSDQKEIVEMLLDSCRYMSGMLSSLLATYRDCSGTIKLNYSEFSLSDLVSECVAEMLYVAKDKEISISIENIFKNSIICADRVQIKRVVMNLLTNAIKYAYNNTPLKLIINSNNGEASFAFTNKSPYISEEKQKSIYGQYVTFTTGNSNLGVGLGLYASKKIIEAHNGEMFLSSSEDNTNTFGFNIPIKQVSHNKENRVYF